MTSPGLAIVAPELEHPRCRGCGDPEAFLWPGELCWSCYSKNDPSSASFWDQGVVLDRKSVV